jgi:hypothetical protein
MGHDTYEQGQFRFHDGGVPYASDNFAWGPEGGYGIIAFADRRGFAILPVKADIAERVAPEQEVAGAFLGIDMQDPCPGAPAIATTMGPTTRAHLDGGFDSEEWDSIAGPHTGLNRPVGRCSCSSTARAPRWSRPRASGDDRRPVSGSIDAAGTTMTQGDVRVKPGSIIPLVAGRRHPADDLRRPACVAIGSPPGRWQALGTRCRPCSTSSAPVAVAGAPSDPMRDRAPGAHVVNAVAAWDWRRLDEVTVAARSGRSRSCRTRRCRRERRSPRSLCRHPHEVDWDNADDLEA